MKTAIVYYSRHHGNTKKVLDAITEKFDVTLIDVTQNPEPELESYDLIGFASGIYYSKFHKIILQVAEQHLPRMKKVFFIYTCGADKESYTAAITKVVKQKCADILGQYGCLGFDTFGPFKFIGGIAKGRPDENDLQQAVQFYESIMG